MHRWRGLHGNVYHVASAGWVLKPVDLTAFVRVTNTHHNKHSEYSLHFGPQARNLKNRERETEREGGERKRKALNVDININYFCTLIVSFKLHLTKSSKQVNALQNK